jgi:hypothetical protein
MGAQGETATATAEHDVQFVVASTTYGRHWRCGEAALGGSSPPRISLVAGCEFDSRCAPTSTNSGSRHALHNAEGTGPEPVPLSLGAPAVVVPRFSTTTICLYCTLLYYVWY